MKSMWMKKGVAAATIAACVLQLAACGEADPGEVQISCLYHQIAEVIDMCHYSCPIPNYFQSTVLFLKVTDMFC